ncbi:hypothetical protein [Methylorubrum aminovorans]|nr:MULTISPECIES: hypothetical protein [Methylobacteriaceae]AWI88915.1 hypothetical protein C0214_12020 [Methylobacterium sp. DM1]QIJ74795.1 hypothetical protein CLZ_09515 [Methylobacterium sp. CLZ]QIJ79701.1 hypothetical protein GU700_09515 [Methylobacterium sp. NI91]
MLTAMQPVIQCLRKVDHAFTVADSTAGERVLEALNELESAYRRPSERIVALEAVLHEFDRRGRVDGTPFSRLLRLAVERRQNKWSRHA